jgi:crotonobetainyl-CoA:carnitine CoA-transferase CaiB-like acyl-CoA transferase
MRKARIPVAPVRNLEEVRTDAHLHARKMLEWKDHPQMGRIVLNNSPIRFSDYDYSDIEFFHRLGADNEAVYADWLGLTDDDIARLKKDGVI